MRRFQRAALSCALVVSVLVCPRRGASGIDVGCPESGTVEASTVVEMSVEDLAARCDLAFEARVTSKSASRDANGRIATDYALGVERTFYGVHQVQRSVRIPGGVLPDGRGLVLPGMPTMAVGETALVFLSQQNQHGERLPIGLAQGRLRVAVDPNGTKSLVRDVSDLDFVDAQGKSVAPYASVATLPYAATIARIESTCANRVRGQVKGPVK